MSDAKKTPQGVAATPAAEIRTGGAAAAPARRRADPEIATLAKLDALLSDVAPDVAVRCLNWLNHKYDIEYLPVTHNPEDR